MDGIHDLGGRQGFGRVEAEVNEPVFHGRWEAKVFACLRALQGRAIYNTDQFRHAIERIRPRAYLEHGYYGRWLGALETLAVEGGVLTQAQLSARAMALGAAADDLIAAQPDAQPAQLSTADGWAGHAGRGGAHRALSTTPRFSVGAYVRCAAFGVPGHTRLPAYARGREGHVVAWHAGWLLPDRNAHAGAVVPEHLYTVAFTAKSLWGDGAEARTQVMLDLFEPYLRAVHAPADEPVGEARR